MLLTVKHIRHLPNIPLAHVAVKLVGVGERCEESKRHVSGMERTNVAEDADLTVGEGRGLTFVHIRYLGNIPLAHIAVEFECSIKHCN